MIVFLIIVLTLGVAAFAVMTGIGNSYIKSEYTADNKVGKRLKSLRWVVVGAMLAILILIMLISGIRIIDSTEIGVVRTWGQINREIGAGFNIINPLSESVDNYDLRVHVREATFSSYTKDAQALDAGVEYQYKLRPGEVLDVAREYGSYEILETKLSSVVEEKVKVVFAEYSAMPLLENRSSLSAQVFERFKELEDLYHVTFTSAVVSNIDFSDAFEASVEAKMKAEQDALKAEQEKKTAVVKAQQDREVAEIQAQAAIAQAQGEAEAIRTVREALIDMPEAYIQQLWIDKWDGKLPTVQAGESSAVIVNPDSVITD